MRKSIYSLILIATITTQISCATVKHVGGLRELQDEFTKISDELSTSTIAAIVPTTVAEGSANSAVIGELTSLRDAQSTLQRATNNELERRAFVKYRAIAKRLAELNKTTEHSLRADNLYGVSMTLQVLAEWKAAFYEHLLRFDKSAKSGNATNMEVSQSFAAVSKKAETTIKYLNQMKVPLFPRDRFFLAAMKPLVRYDLAYLWAVRWNREGKLYVSATPTGENGLSSSERKAICGYAVKIAEQMATAERELGNIKFKKDTIHISRFVAIQRYTMLRTATLVLVDMNVNMTDTGADWGAAEAIALTPILRRQADTFVSSWNKEGHAVRNAMTSIGLTSTTSLAGYYLASERQAAGMNWTGLQTMTTDDETELDAEEFEKADEPRNTIRDTLMTPVP